MEIITRGDFGLIQQTQHGIVAVRQHELRAPVASEVRRVYVSEKEDSIIIVQTVAQTIMFRV